MRAALTFDAEHPDRHHCPPGAFDAVLASLSSASVPATFFLQGRWASAYPARAARIAADGHLIGNHSQHHAPLPHFSDDGLRREVLDADEAIQAATGATLRPWFRCPFGRGYKDQRVLATLAELGYRNVHWHVHAFDWIAERHPLQIEQDLVTGALEHGDGAILLLHTWTEQVPTLLPRLIGRLRRAGVNLVTVDQLDLADLPSAPALRRNQ